jgi:hypothetical protein
VRHTAETRAALSAARTGAGNPFFGRTHTDEAKAKIGNATRGRTPTRQYDLEPQAVTIPAGERLGYLAGLVDGEGSMRFARGRPFVAVYGELVIAEWLRGTIGGTYGKPDLRGRVPNYAWRIGGARDVYAVCCAIRPLLIVKAGDCDAVITALEARYGSRITD